MFYFSLHEVKPAKVSLISFNLFLSPCAEIPKQDRSIYRATHKEKVALVEVTGLSRAKTQKPSFHLDFFVNPRTLMFLWSWTWPGGWVHMPVLQDKSTYSNSQTQSAQILLCSTPAHAPCTPANSLETNCGSLTLPSMKCWIHSTAAILALSEGADTSLLLGGGYLHYSKALKKCEGSGIYGWEIPAAVFSLTLDCPSNEAAWQFASELFLTRSPFFFFFLRTWQYY